MHTADVQRCAILIPRTTRIQILTVFLAAFLVPLGIVPDFAEDTQAGTSDSPSPSFGEPGVARFDTYQPGPSMGNNAGEPGVGVSWVSGAAMINDFTRQLRVEWDDNVFPPTADWDLATSPYSVINVDPILFMDVITGRTFAGGLDGGCSILSYTDDDGRSWTPMTDACSLPGWDHPTIGAGPFAPNMEIFGDQSPLYPHAVYYCAQVGLQPGPAFCAVSADGGLTFVETAPPWINACDGLHGHVRVGPDGSAYLPDKDCGGDFGFSVTEDNGLTWNVRKVPGSKGDGRFDPSVAPTYDSGWAYIGQAESDGAYIAMTKDKGLSWEDMGTGNGADPGTKAFNVGALADPPIQRAEFAEVIAGDDERAAFAFLGSTSSSPNVASCSQSTDHAWYYYMAMTYDAGKTWEVQRVTDDPVQRGPIGDSGACRNLLDFNDISLDSEGRVVLGYADGCIGSCALPDGTHTQSRSEKATITRQTTGLGLFAAFDGGGSALAISVDGPYAGDVGTPIAMSASASGGETPYSFAWDFGDGATGTGAAVTHTYTSSGTFTVEVTVTDASGNTSVATTTATATEDGATPFVNITQPSDGDAVRDVTRIAGDAGHSGGSTTQPLEFAGLETANASGTEANLSWSQATGGEGPYSYLVHQGPAGSVDLTTPVQETTSLTTTVSGLTPGQEVCFVVRAKDSTGATDTNTVEVCVLPEITAETITFYFHDGELVDAPEPAPDNTFLVRGGMDLASGDAPKSTLTGGAGPYAGQQATAEDAREAYPVVFESGALASDLVLAGGVEDHTGSRSELVETVASSALLKTCIANNLEGVFFADVYEITAAGAIEPVLTSDGFDWADTNLLADGPDGACVGHKFKYVDGGSSHTFAEGSTILVGIQPDNFGGGVTNTFKWDGTGLHDSHIEFSGAYDAVPTPVEDAAEPVGDARTSESDFTGLGVQTTATDLKLTLPVDDLAAMTQDGPHGGPIASEFITYNILFTHDGVAYDYEVYTNVQTSGLWSYEKGSDSDGTATFDYGGDRILVSIPWAEIGAQPGDAIVDLHAQTYQGQGFIGGLVADDRVPDVGGKDLSVPTAVGAMDGDDLVLYVHEEERETVAIRALGVEGATPAGLRGAPPERAAATARVTAADDPVVARTAPFDMDGTLGDTTTADIYLSTFEDTLDATLHARLEKVTMHGVEVFGTTSVDLFGLDAATRKVSLDIPLGSDASVAAGESLQLVTWVDATDPVATHWVWYDGARAPTRITVPVTFTTAVVSEPDSEGGGGMRLLAEDDPAELPAGYESFDLKNAIVSSDGVTITPTFQLYGFDPTLPGPGIGSGEWDFNFEHDGRTLGVWIVSNGMVDPAFEGHTYCLGCGTNGAWASVASGYPVSIDGDTISTTVPLSDFEGVLGGTAPAPGDTLTRTHLQARAQIPGSPSPASILPTIDRAPGGGSEETFLSSGAFGQDYTIPDPNETAPPTISSFGADVTSGAAPLEVTFSGTVVAGDAPVTGVEVDFGDGSAPVAADLAEGTFSASHVYEDPGDFVVTATATDANELSATAQAAITIDPLTPGVHLKVGDQPLVKATDDSAEGDWSVWHLDFDFGVFAPETTVPIEATYFDGKKESAPATILVNVLEGGLVEIASPADGSFVDPSNVTVTGTTSDSASSSDGSGDGSATTAGMWTLPFDDDVDQDRMMDVLEDHLDTRSATDLVNVKLLLDRPATEADAETLQALTGASYAYAIDIIDAVDLEGVPKYLVRQLLDHPGAVKVEWILPAEQHADVAMQAAKARHSTTYADACVWGGTGCLGYTGRGVGYANFDSGVRESHEVFEWHAFAPAGASATDSKIVERLSAFTHEPNGAHATQTAGLAVGTGGASGTYTGAAPGAHLINVQATSPPSGTAGTISTRTCQAIDMMIQAKDVHDIRVASLSYGSLLPVASSDDQCVDRAVDAGIVVTVSSGNFGGMGTPATAAKAITVGNVDDMRTVSRLDDVPCHGVATDLDWIGACGVSGSVAATTENVGKPELMAPGTCMTTPTNSNDRAYARCTSGTSWSAPLVAGVVALMLEANPHLTPAEVEEILTSTAHVGDAPPTGAWAPMVGYGYVDAHAAVQEAVDRAGGADLSVSVAGPHTTAPGVDLTLSADVFGGTQPYSYAWDFGDGATSTEASPTHAWSAEGTYTVVLTVTDADGTVVSDETTVTVASTLTASIASPTAGDEVSGNVTVSGTSFFPASGGEATLDVDDPLWTDASGDATVFGAGTLPVDWVDVLAGYTWGDGGVDDPDFNLGIGLAELPEDPRNAEYARYGIQFAYGGKEYWLDTKINPVFSAQNQDPELTPEFRLLSRAQQLPGETGVSQWSLVGDLTGAWDPTLDVVSFDVPKDMITDTSGDAIPPGATIGDLIAMASLGAATASGQTDGAPAPDSLSVTVSPSAGDPHTLVTFGGLGPVRANGTSWSATFDTTRLPDGPVTATAQATDGLGGFSDLVSVMVNVANDGGDSTPGDPFVTIETPAANATVSGSLDLAGTAGHTDGGGTSTSSSVTVEALRETGKTPLPVLMRLDADGPVRAYLIDWGDGEVQYGLGDPSGIVGHTYETPGTHTVKVSIVDPTGLRATDLVDVRASPPSAGEPGPSKPTLYFHMQDVDGDDLVDLQWTNADDADPDANADSITSGSVGGDGAEIWPLDPAPTQDLFVTPGGVGTAKLEFSSALDPQATVQLDVLVGGLVVATGSTTADFLLLQSTTVEFDVLVDPAWSGTIPAGADVQVVTKFEGVGGGTGVKGFDLEGWSLTLPFTTSGGGGSGGAVESTVYYGHDIRAAWNSGGCLDEVAAMDTTFPTGEPDAGWLAPGCTSGQAITLQTAPLADEIVVAGGEASQVTTYVGSAPFADAGVWPLTQVDATLGTASDPAAVGSERVVVSAIVNELGYTAVVLDIRPTTDVTIPAGEMLQLKLLFQSVQGWHPTAVGGGEGHPYSLDLKTVADVTEQPPAQVTGLVATPGDGQVTLSWDAVSGAAKYDVYRNDTTLIGNTTATMFTDSGLANDVPYTYSVRAVSLTGLEGPTSETVTATPSGGTTTTEKVEVSVRRASDSLLVLEPTTADGIASWNRSWDTTAVDDGDYIVTATYTDSEGLMATASTPFSVDNVPDVVAPTVTLSASADTVGSGASLSFTVNATDGGGTLSYAWDFGDGTTIASGAATETHAYAEPGFYTATVTVSNAAGSDSDSVRTTVQDPRFVEVRFVPVGDEANATAWQNATATASDGSFATWETSWDATGLVGDHTIMARFFDGFDMNGPTTGTVTVDEAPTAALTTAPSSVDMDDVVTFDGSASTDPDGSIVEYRFDAGDGSGTVSTAAPTLDHEYSSEGTYTVSLVVVDDLGRTSDPATASVTVTNTLPVATVSAANTTKTLTPILFEGSQSFDPDGSTLDYAWDFGDGAVSTAIDPTHSYDKSGNYTVSLTVTDAHGGQDTATHTVEVANTPPRAVLVVTPEDDFTLVDRTLAGVLSDDPDGTLAQYRFDAGDGSGPVNTTDHTVSHTYMEPGTYTATLSVVDDEGAESAVESVVVTVRNRPVDLGEIGARSVDEDQWLNLTIVGDDPEGDPVTLTMDGTPSNATFTDNGDGTADFSWRAGWFDAGTYTVTVTASDGDTAADVSETFDITVVNVDRPAAFGTYEDPTIREQWVWTESLSASDPDGDAVSFTVFDMPDGMQATDNGDGTLSLRWQPSSGASGVYPIVVRARSNDLTTDTVLLLTVTAPLKHSDGFVIEGSPGGPVAFRLNAKNIADVNETLTFTASSTDGWNVTAPSPVTLLPGEVRTITGLVTVPDSPDAVSTTVRLTAVSSVDPTQTMRLAWVVEVPVVATVTFEEPQPTATDPVRGQVTLTYLDGSPVTTAAVSVEQRPDGVLGNTRSTTQAEHLQDGVWSFNFNTVDHPTARAPGHHDVTVDVVRSTFAQSFESGYDVGWV